jgi:hypothetical protein
MQLSRFHYDNERAYQYCTQSAVGVLRKSGLLAEDLGCHIVRASRDGAISLETASGQATPWAAFLKGTFAFKGSWQPIEIASNAIALRAHQKPTVTFEILTLFLMLPGNVTTPFPPLVLALFVSGNSMRSSGRR